MSRAVFGIVAVVFAGMLVATAGVLVTQSEAVATVPVAPVAAAQGGAQAVASATQTQLEQTSCVRCHFDDTLFEPDEIAALQGYHDDVHASVGLSCHDCHGGNPDPALFEDMSAAMDEDYSANPYIGRPEVTDVPSFCGRCHSDASYMRRYGPSIITDQESEYRTSKHGQLLAEGDINVATCVSCHGVHGIRRPTDPLAPVYPTAVAETCSNCHASAEHMAGYTLENGDPLPIDQYARWQESVHAAAMFEREDLSAPTCNDCHGNHGANPPGLDSIAFVCGQCHGREATIFRNSPKRAGFERHNEYLADAGSDGCAACHDAPEPQATLTGITQFGECEACHGNHGVVRPTLSFLSPLPETPCAFCHGDGTGSSEGVHVVESEEHLAMFRQTRDGLLAQAADRGLEDGERYDWLVDRALELPNHTLGTQEDGTLARRPEFDRLFTKFRIGKTSYTYEDPTTGEQVRAPILRCANCHASQEILGDDAIGMRTAGQILGNMRELTSRTASAERVLLSARRGGVETGEAGLEVDRAVDAQISLEVLLHTFNVSEGGDFLAAHAEGMQHADAALAAGQSALAELLYRRQGLAVALGLILLVLIGLALKIRQLSAEEADA
ncbi:MAG: cytochrome c3 family protein [Acidobacteriota bacterium]|jgi:hypothetical protein